MVVRAPADKRFRRAQVKSGRRRRTWRGRAWRLASPVMLAAAIAYAGYRVTALITHAPAFRVGHIVVRGNDRLSTGEVLAVLDGMRGQSLIGLNLEVWRRRLLRSSWVAEAALRRILPSTVEVVVAERRPMGIARLGRELYLVDERGTIIDEYGPNYAELDLPIIDGLAAPPRDRGPAIDEARARLVSRLLDKVRLREDLARRISQIDVTDARDAVVLLEGDTAFIRLGDDRFLERLQSYVELASTLRERVPEIDYVDLRFDERVYVRPAERSVGPAAKRSGQARVQQRPS